MTYNRDWNLPRDAGVLELTSQTSAPGITIGKLYNVSGALYWNGSAVTTVATGTLAALTDVDLSGSPEAPIDGDYLIYNGTAGTWQALSGAISFPILAPWGDPSAPSFSFVDTGSPTKTMGMYRHDENTLGFSIDVNDYVHLKAFGNNHQSISLGRDAAATIGASSNNEVVAIGYEAMNNTNADQCVAIGYRALAGTGGAVTGDGNIAIGSNAGDSITSGPFNILIGTNAGQALSTAFGNTLIGHNAGQSVTGGYNVFVGYLAGDSASSGATHSVLVGSEAGQSMTTSVDGQVMIGYRSGYNSTSTTGSVFVGYQSGYNADGNSNTALGYSALGGTTGGTMTRNVAVGYQTGDAITTGSDNVLIGYQVDASGATTSNELRIGNRNLSSVDPIFVEMNGSGQDRHTYNFSGIVDGPVLRNYHEVVETVITSGAGGSPQETLDIANANVFDVYLDGDSTTIAFAGALAPDGSPALDFASTITVIVHQAGSPAGGTITWPASVLWAGGTPPTLTATTGAIDIFTFLTTDGGTTWYGMIGGQDFS